MTKKEKWIVDDAGTLIDMVTGENFDIVEEVVDLLNELSDENEQLKKENKTLADGLTAYFESKIKR